VTELIAAAEASLGNPFEDAAAFRRSADAVRARRAEIPAAVARLNAAGRTGEARRLVVAGARWSDGDALPVDDEALSGLKLGHRELAELVRAAARCAARLDELAGPSAAMQRVRAATWRAAFGASLYEAMQYAPFLREQNVLVLGETGTGKELIAEAIAAGTPGSGELVAINAAAIPAGLLESELFGHVKGAFTQAVADRRGTIAAAHRGTLFLDEIADLALAVQPKLLRAIDTNRITPVGGGQPADVDVRYVSATSQPVAELVERGEFRRDLYERLAGIAIEVPPLRDRREDVAPIADALFARFGQRIGALAGADEATTESNVMRLVRVQASFRLWLRRPEIAGYDWPGNVRELENAVRQHILGFAAGGVGGGPEAPTGGDAVALRRFLDGEATLQEVEDWYVMHVMAKHQFRQRKAASALGIDRGTLARRLRKIEGRNGEDDE
jgi:transcriptional regulator with PAS, ATPase and Fis domain